MAFIKGQYMSIVRSAESAERILKEKGNRLSASDKRNLNETIKDGEVAKEHLRRMGVEI